MFVYVIVLFVQIAHCEEAWSYTEQGKWPIKCNGISQSPISISQQDALDAQCDKLEFSLGYYEHIEATLTNTGHSLEVRLQHDKTPPPTVSGGGLDGRYVLVSLHFHWSAEHVINDYRYPLEAHFVHYALKYGNVSNALNYDAGVGVLAVFYELAQVHNHVFDALLPAVPSVAHDVDHPRTLSTSVKVSDFLPCDTDRFFRYRGSLTTPPCNEGVVWTLLARPSFIAKQQMEMLRDIWTTERQLLGKNYRPLQRVNGRKIYYVQTK